MSAETLTTLNTETLIGFTDKRGHAWHYRAEEQGNESNHYRGAIPVADVTRRLFNWDALSVPVAHAVPMSDDTADALTPDGLDADGFPFQWVTTPGEQAIIRSDTGHKMGTFKAGYVIHSYEKWLLDSIATLLDDDLSIGSAGLLRGGAMAWVSVEVPENIRTPEGVEFRPNMLACTSHDGSLATTYSRAVTNVVCDNTMSAALAERGQRIKVKHSRRSLPRLTEARQALALVHSIADDFAAEVAELCRIEVTNRQWIAFLDAYAELPTTAGRARTTAEHKRAALGRLWRHDARVSPWQNTAYGVIQAVNTYVHHEQTVRGAARAERNMTRAVTGAVDQLDRDTLTALQVVLAA